MAAPAVGEVFAFDAKQHVVTVNGIVLTNFADGDVISVSMNEDQNKLKVGVTGETTYSRTNNYSGAFEFSLMQSSPANDALSIILLADLQTPLGVVVPIFIADILGTTRFVAKFAKCAKWPDHKTAMEAQAKTWRFIAGRIVQYHGGNFPPVFA